MPPFAKLDDAVAKSAVGKWFCLEGSGAKKERLGSRFTKELLAGVTTWAAMAYIISVNASILADSGGTCVCTDGQSCINERVYLSCVNEVRQDLITSTAAISSLASFLIGLLANLPVALAPGLGLNAYFAYSVVGFHGSGMITYQQALAAVFLEGWIFMFLSIIGLRQWMVRAMPHSLVLGVGAGIGFFIAFIGLSSHGLGIIGGDKVNFVGLGGCLAEDYISKDLPYYCQGGFLRNPTMWLGIFCGGILTMILMMYRVRGAMLIGILLTSALSWPRSTPFTYFPHTETGNALFDYFKQVASFRHLQKVGNALDYRYDKPQVWYALLTFLYVDIIDTTGTLYTMAKFAGLRDQATHDFEGSTMAYCVDAFSISVGALLGVSPVTTYIESATGISEGGKTGLTGMTTGLMFLISVFFAPIFSSIPPWATGGTLIVVGCLMIRNVLEINWNYIGDAVPAFLTMLIIPLTYNVAYGVIAGIFTYLLLNGIPFIIMKITRDKITPFNYHRADEWVAPPGGILPPWIKRLVHMKKKDAVEGHIELVNRQSIVTSDSKQTDQGVWAIAAQGRTYREDDDRC